MNVLKLSGSFYARSYRYLEAGPGHFLMYIFGRFGLVRSFMVSMYSLRHSTPAVAGPTHIDDVNVDQAVRAIRQDGFVPGLRLRDDVVTGLLDFASSALCFGEGKTEYPFRYADKEAAEQQFGQTFRLGRYNQGFVTSPLLHAIASDTQLLALARAYLKTEPVLISARMWWSFAGEAAAEEQIRAGQGFHYDLDGYRGLTFFFYLTDVQDQSMGPHIYIRGSHVKKALGHIVSIYKARADSEINRYYKSERQVVCYGPAGSGFAEDIFGFHKGMLPASRDRLILQVRYGLRDYGTGRAD